MQIIIILALLLSGCAIATEGFPHVDVQGHMDHSPVDMTMDKVDIFFCANRENASTVTIDDNGIFNQELGYVHGGILLIIPPLGDFPRNTPSPPDICISFPNIPGNYYKIKATRNEVVWSEKSEAGIEIEKQGVLPPISKAKLIEINKRGVINDWMLRLDFEDSKKAP